jgi:MFS family permease
MLAGKLSTLRSAFSNRNYAIYISGNWLSLLGFWMQRTAVAWLAWEVSRSEFWVGAVAFADISPLIFVGPLFGVWADRFDRKSLAQLLQTLMLLQALALYFIILFDLLTIEWLFVLALVEGIIQAAYQPVRLSLVPNLVRKQDIVAATAFTAVAFNVARFIGPALAGVVIEFYSAAWAVLFNAISYLLIVITWFFIDLPPNAASSKAPQSLLRDLHDGFVYILHRRALFAMFTLMTIIALFARPLTFMLPAFVGAVYEAGPGTLALFTSSVGAGAVIAGLRVSVSGKTEGLIRSILLSSVITVLALIWFASTDNRMLATALIFCFGYAITTSAVASQTLVQNSVDDAMRGRVLSLWVAFTRGGPAAGVLLIGWVATYTGLQWPNIVAALLCLGGVLLMVRERREMRQFFERDEASESDVSY